MPDTWLHDHLGDEARPSARFEAQLADTLHAAWADPQSSMTVSPQQSTAPRRTLRPWLAVAAAVAVFGAGGIYLAVDDGKPQITGDSSVTTLAPSTSIDVTTGPTSTATPTTATETTPQPTTQAIAAVASTPEEQTVLDYFTVLSLGRWADAAKLLGEGGLSWEERADLRPLVGDDGTLPDLAAALQQWCEQPALCGFPQDIYRDGARVTVSHWVAGTTRETTFVSATFEGSPLVVGLPLRLPPDGGSLADTVQCPIAGVKDFAYADLDGDGWIETITDSPDASLQHTLEVCGTTLVVPQVTARSQKSFVLWTLDVEGDGTDELLHGSIDVDTFYGSVIRWDGTGLEGTGQQVTRSNPLDGAPGTSFGCEDLAGVGRGLVQYSYQYEGGTDLSNSTALTFSRTILNDDGSVNPIPLPLGRYELPAQEQEAFRLIAGYCGNLSVQTG
ncbi:MAG: hypothetical protein ABMA25_20240 [Ilumatobacteraceae bacterium]